MHQQSTIDFATLLLRGIIISLMGFWGDPDRAIYITYTAGVFSVFSWTTHACKSTFEHVSTRTISLKRSTKKKHNINNCIKKLCTKARIDVNQMNTCEYNPIIVANQTTYIYIYMYVYTCNYVMENLHQINMIYISTYTFTKNIYIYNQIYINKKRHWSAATTVFWHHPRYGKWHEVHGKVHQPHYESHTFLGLDSSLHDLALK